MSAIPPAAGPTVPLDERPYIIRTYDRWIILVIVLVVGWLIFRPLIAFTVYYRGLSFERMFHLTDAEYYYRKSTRVDPKIPQGWLGWGELEYSRAPGDRVARQNAITIFRTGLSYNPRTASLAFDLGRAFFLDKQYTNARDAFVQSAQLNPTDMFSWDFAAWSSLRAGDTQLARKYWHEVLKIDPGNATAARQLAKLMQQGRIQSLSTWKS
ncbi:MAG: tetratricopeptide repeat protein [Candidatus Eremiobacteraeota bacterium]|nr:tetratricopeptide repeat protein [Candidatus Eremiobacteraeota bacterium]MBV8594768.1 tetratricopeptide repeat protein [Candidatus Eremiobacteraeota bacterium]MBV8668853.1 tetratricopeptide repeat protein [Candidatus Eremiobacteraeota bacterium]